MTISYARLQEYLSLIGPRAGNAPHGEFWDVDRNIFIGMNIPGVGCNGAAIPAVDAANPAASGFLEILKAGLCENPQMPRFAKKVTSASYNVTLSDGSVVTGAQMLQDIEDWLVAGCPEK
ncbi:hypothetical protein GCM10010520_36540 [Rhizobium viscosum]|uniref:Uncharacterized protein n=1 Tax=Rhizobium viscosum TaxID=1673 RepID=A0ABR9ISE5_RHIVS|nr:hypothetical protein [Rhizobium viscosum]MBE1506063.1 hypothetical protein [Rhizobium viscosum]